MGVSCIIHHTRYSTASCPAHHRIASLRFYEELQADAPRALARIDAFARRGALSSPPDAAMSELQQNFSAAAAGGVLKHTAENLSLGVRNFAALRADGFVALRVALAAQQQRNRTGAGAIACLAAMADATGARVFPMYANCAEAILTRNEKSSEPSSARERAHREQMDSSRHQQKTPS